jgi:hypothetical protein
VPAEHGRYLAVPAPEIRGKHISIGAQKRLVCEVVLPPGCCRVGPSSYLHQSLILGCFVTDRRFHLLTAKLGLGSTMPQTRIVLIVGLTASSSAAASSHSNRYGRRDRRRRRTLRRPRRRCDQAQLANAQANLNRYTPLEQKGFATSQLLDTQKTQVAQLETAVKADQAPIIPNWPRRASVRSPPSPRA